MSDRAAGRVAALAVTLAIIGLALIAFCRSAGAHQSMGHFGMMLGSKYLWGQRIGNPEAGTINCCLHKGSDGKSGDCFEYTGKVRNVEGGVMLDDGEFIAAGDISVSPQDADGEYRTWRCKHPDKPSHCFHRPPSGM